MRLLKVVPFEGGTAANKRSGGALNIRIEIDKRDFVEPG